MRAIRLMADYDCFPLWEAGPDQVGNIDPDTLPLSAALRLKLAQWAALYDATLDRDDPARSGFPHADAEHAFKRTGIALAEELRRELGKEFSVVVKDGVS